MNTAPRPVNQTPDPMGRKPHMCFTGDLACSGCAPCIGCTLVLRDFLLPHVLAAGQVIATPEQAEAVFRAFMSTGWQVMAEHMMRNPLLVNRFTQTDVQALLAEVSALRQEVSVLRPLAGNIIEAREEPQDGEEQQSPQVFAEEPQTDIDMDAIAAAMREQTLTGYAPADQEEPRSALQEPLTVEDVLAAVVPASPNRVALGNVMDVPPELQHQLDEINRGQT